MQLIDKSILSGHVLRDAWAVYQNIHLAIDALEDAGLSIEGADKTRDGRKNVSALFGALTGIENIIFEAAGIQRDTKTAEQASERLSSLAEQNAGYEQVRQDLAELAAGQTANGQELSYEVTVSMTGGIAVSACSIEDAMSKVNGLDTDAILLSADWNSPEATDAYENF